MALGSQAKFSSKLI